MWEASNKSISLVELLAVHCLNRQAINLKIATPVVEEYPPPIWPMLFTMFFLPVGF
jgi:hypothetical protein